MFLRDCERAFKPVPWASESRHGARIDEADFFQSVVHAAEVAGGAGDDKIVGRCSAAPFVRHQVIVLEPHALKGCVLFVVAPTPREDVGVCRLKCLADLLPDEGNSAEPAVVSIPR